MLVRTSNDPQTTIDLGKSLGRLAQPGTVVALIGDLGAGKTVLARGVGEGLGVTSTVRSPSFIIVQTHHGGRLPFWHADLYRLDDPEEIEQLGLDEVLHGDGVVLLEWADRFPEVLPTDHLEIRILDQGGDGPRQIEILATGPRHAALEQGLAR